MEYTGKESYGGTVDDGGRREMTVIEKADLVIKIVRILERYSDRQGWSQVLHHAFFKNVAIEIAQAIEALTPKGDENGLLPDEEIRNSMTRAMDEGQLYGDDGKPIPEKEVAKAQQALTRRESLEKLQGYNQRALTLTERIHKDLSTLIMDAANPWDLDSRLDEYVANMLR